MVREKMVKQVRLLGGRNIVVGARVLLPWLQHCNTISTAFQERKRQGTCIIRTGRSVFIGILVPARVASKRNSQTDQSLEKPQVGIVQLLRTGVSAQPLVDIDTGDKVVEDELSQCGARPRVLEDTDELRGGSRDQVGCVVKGRAEGDDGGHDCVLEVLGLQHVSEEVAI